MRVTLQQEHLEISFDSGRVGHFDYLWLRDNCPSGFHPTTHERVFDILSVPEDVRVAQAHVEAGALHLSWAQDAHQGVYNLDWLERFAESQSDDMPVVTTWDASLRGTLPTVEYADVTQSKPGLQRWMEALCEYGIVLLTGGPSREDEVLRLTGLIGPPRPTNFGATFDVISKPNPNNNAYTAIELFAHMDLPNWHRPPDYQFLYCLTNSAPGGESVLVDGFRVANVLRDEDPEAFEVLTRVPMQFRFHDQSADIQSVTPAIRLDARGEVREIRFNRAIMGTLVADKAKMRSLYRAHRAFTALSRDPALAVRLKLNPGEMLCFDNLRVLHGRAAFDPNQGFRHLQGCYVDREFVQSTLRVLRAEGESEL
ncbi:MAG: TauD/TfdA family dioxygenase [Gammaproteobacteria bacterium]|nr:TauD/TfdA family dioxygenase [Gammaproteobacteria bacterium]